MNPEKQIIAITEACGWSHWFNGWNKLEDNSPPLVLTQDLPDYTNDLNAMHEAEKMLTVDQLPIYLKLINEMPSPSGGFCATASQRAEAFLKTIGKWEEEK